jgi:hypothetical protein
MRSTAKVGSWGLVLVQSEKMKSSRGYENSFHIREETQGAHGGRSGFKKGQEAQLKVKGHL